MLIFTHLHELTWHLLEHIGEKLSASFLLKLELFFVASLIVASDCVRLRIATVCRDKIGPFILVAIHAKLRQSKLPKCFALAHCVEVGLLYCSVNDRYWCWEVSRSIMTWLCKGWHLFNHTFYFFHCVQFKFILFFSRDFSLSIAYVSLTNIYDVTLLPI